MSSIEKESFNQKWQHALQSPIFRRKLIAVIIALTFILSFFPWFFQTIEKRHGIVINDWLLNALPVYDVSLPVFLMIWFATAFTIFRLVRTPELLVSALWVYVFLCISRIITISLIPLDPPANIIALADPLANKFYGHAVITHDLFYSGHTSSVVLMYLALQKKWEKAILMAITITVGILLLVQHVHYTMDVVAAPVFTYLIYSATPRFTRIFELQRRNRQKASPN